MSDVKLKAGLPKVLKDEDVPAELKKRVSSAKINLVRSLPFMGFLVLSTEYHYTNEIPTMAATTHGGRNRVFIGTKWTSELKIKEIAFVIAHEIMHIFFQHLGRQTQHGYNPQVWNIATDFCINTSLVESADDIRSLDKKVLFQMPKIGLIDKKYSGMSADAIYHELMKDAKNNPDKIVAQFGTPMDGEGQGGSDGEGSSGMRPFDELQTQQVSDADAAKLQQQLSASLAQDNDLDSHKNRGSGVANLIRQFEDLLEHKIPWQTLLRDFITESSKNRYTYNRPSRKSYSSEIVFPTMTGNTINLVFGVDTSGSMSAKDLAEALSELQGICEEFDDWIVNLISCDTQAHHIGEYNSEEGDDFSTIDKSLVGGGGTQMHPMIEFANDMEEAPAVCIIITDGYVDPNEMDEAVDDIPVLVLVTEDGNQDLELSECVKIDMERLG